MIPDLTICVRHIYFESMRISLGRVIVWSWFYHQEPTLATPRYTHTATDATFKQPKIQLICCQHPCYCYDCHVAGRMGGQGWWGEGLVRGWFATSVTCINSLTPWNIASQGNQGDCCRFDSIQFNLPVGPSCVSGQYRESLSTRRSFRGIKLTFNVHILHSQIAIFCGSFIDIQ